MKRTLCSTIAGLGLLGACIFAQATELVYVPVNPSFGGNPLNGSFLLNSAQATNKHKEADPFRDSLLNQSPLQQFNDSLERAVLGQLASSVSSKIVGPNGQLVPGTIDTGNFRISVTDIGGGVLQVTTTDKATGATNVFQVGQP